MGNNAKKKEEARIHNEMRVARKEAKEAERVDRIENPHKYMGSKSAKRHARLWLSAATGMGFNSF